MINEEKEKEIVSLLEKKRDDKLFYEVTGYISRLDGYIYKLEKENQQLKEQLKQSEEVIDETINTIESWSPYLTWAENDRLKSIIEILQRYKGDNK